MTRRWPELVRQFSQCRKRGSVPVLRIRAYVTTPVALTEPLHFDGLAAAVARGASKTRLTRADDGRDIVRPPLPIASITHGGHELYVCSAAEVAPNARRSREHLTRRRDGADLDYLESKVDTRSGPGRDVMMPYPVWLTPYVEWWCVGTRQGVRTMVAKRTTHVGMLRRHGMGEVSRWEIEVVEGDPVAVLLAGGRARRNLPREWCEAPEVVEHVPLSAPYWHPSVRAAGVRAGRLTGLASALEAKVTALC